MARSAFYSVTRKGGRDCQVIVLARDPDAKQVLFGWGSDKHPSIEFYGRGTGRGTGENEVWEWKLSPDGIDELQRNLQDQLDRPKYYGATKRENKAATQLLKKLNKACRR